MSKVNLDDLIQSRYWGEEESRYYGLTYRDTYNIATAVDPYALAEWIKWSDTIRISSKKLPFSQIDRPTLNLKFDYLHALIYLYLRNNGFLPVQVVYGFVFEHDDLGYRIPDDFNVGFTFLCEILIKVMVDLELVEELEDDFYNFHHAPEISKFEHEVAWDDYLFEKESN